MSVTQWVTNVWRRRGSDPMPRPKPGQVVESAPLDRWRDYPADGLAPERLVSILRLADEGDVAQAMALYAQLEEKDAHLYSVANMRRLAVTGLPWQIVSAADVREGMDRAAADEAAAFCREMLSTIEGWDEVLQHLSLATGRNVAVAENVWEMSGDTFRLVDVCAVDFDRITFDDQGRARILTGDDPVHGIALPPGKFVVHTPQSVSGHAMRGGLLRVSALAYLGKHYAMKDWMIFAEVFGMPVRVARYEPSATPEEKRELLRMLQSLGADASGIFSKAVELQLLEAGQGNAPPPYESICNFFNRELSKAWLGQTLTVETVGRKASLSAATVHDEIRLDLRQDDLVKEGRTIRRDVLTPMVRVAYGEDVPVPFFRRQFDPKRDREKLARVLDVAVNALGMEVPTSWAHDALGVPEAEGEEATVRGKRTSLG